MVKREMKKPRQAVRREVDQKDRRENGHFLSHFNLNFKTNINILFNT